MDKSERDVGREYERQTEKLDLLAKELQIQRDEKTIKSKSTEMNALQDNLKTITDIINVLGKPRDQSQKASRGRSCFDMWRISKQTFESRGINSAMKKQLNNKFETELRTSKVLRTISELEPSVSAARIIVEEAKTAYQLRWGEEQCCRANRVELSNIVKQLAISKEETESTKKKLDTLKELFENCNEQKLKQANILERAEMKLQAANQKLDEQSKEIEKISADLQIAYQDKAKMLSEDGIRGESVLDSSKTPVKVALEVIDSRMSSTSATKPDHLEAVTDVTDLIAELNRRAERMRNIISKTLRASELEVQVSIRENQACQNKIDQMMPLYEVGVDTRQRKYELDMKDIKDSRPDWNLVNKGNEAAHNGRALADAMMFHHLCTEAHTHRSPGEFEDQYNKVPAKVLWQHQDFTIFHDILSWHMDMRQFGATYKNKKFDEDFEFLFFSIYPSFEVSSNEAIREDPKLHEAYVNLSSTHADANRRVKARRREQRDS